MQRKPQVTKCIVLVFISHCNIRSHMKIQHPITLKYVLLEKYNIIIPLAVCHHLCTYKLIANFSMYFR